MTKTRRGAACIALALLLASSASARAEDHAAGSDREAEYRHLLALFGGATHEDGEEAATFGVEYMYVLVEHRVAVGALLERAESPIDGTLLFGLVHFEPVASLYFSLGVGGERRHGETKTVARVGAGYHFRIGERWVIAPEINLDLIDREEAIVYGINAGWRF